jgi:hypothetical protein
MTYTRPEVTILALASDAIQSDSAGKSNSDHVDNHSNYATAAAYEVDE